MWSGPLWHPALEVVGPLVSSSPESPSPTTSRLALACALWCTMLPVSWFLPTAFGQLQKWTTHLSRGGWPWKECYICVHVCFCLLHVFACAGKNLLCFFLMPLSPLVSWYLGVWSEEEGWSTELEPRVQPEDQFKVDIIGHHEL